MDYGFLWGSRSIKVYDRTNDNYGAPGNIVDVCPPGVYAHTRAPSSLERSFLIVGGRLLLLPENPAKQRKSGSKKVKVCYYIKYGCDFATVSLR